MEKIISQKVLIDNLIMMSSNSCGALNVRNGDLLLYLEVFESLYYINRDDVETKLILFTNTSSNWTLGDHSKVTVTISKSDEALMLPYLALKLGRTPNCFIEAVSRVSFITVFKNVLVSPLLRCRQIRLHGDEFGVDWTHTRNKYTYFGFSISVQKFESYFDGGLRVCAKDIQTYIRTVQETLVHENRTLSYLTLTLICVSLFFLLITFLTYCAFPSLRTLPGWNNIILVIFLFFAQLCLVVRPFFRSTSMIVASALTHFFWLSTFLWLQVCSFHMYRVFHSKTRCRFSKSYSRLTVVKYLAYATGISVFVVAANITVSLIITNGEFTGYDKLMTLMTSRTAFIVTLIGPLSIVCITNITFYIFTAYMIHSTPNVDNTTRYRIQLTVYVKLFTLTGVSWLLQVVDTFIGVSVLSYIIAILNGLQGLFLFTSYVYNNRVFNLYREALKKFGLSRRSSRQSLND
uniref:Latrophilin receptor-like protein A n=1 Tax=Magallana gigas TaxID=29159 RepID=K1QYB2_MAGGI